MVVSVVRIASACASGTRPQRVVDDLLQRAGPGERFRALPHGPGTGGQRIGAEGVAVEGVGGEGVGAAQPEEVRRSRRSAGP